LGTELFGYWGFFASPDNVKVIEDNMDAFLDLLFSEDWKLLEEYLGPKGGLEKWFGEGKRSKRAAFVSEEVFDWLTLKELGSHSVGFRKWRN
jgi:soluble epoxide hydrolase / lipid-phosphate phosphatase